MKRKDQTPFVLKVVRWWFPKIEAIAPWLAHQYFLKIFFSPLRYKTPEKEKIAETFAKKFHFTVSGMRIQGYEWGDAKPYVLVVHGWAGRATQFRRFIRPLEATGFRIIGFDGPAHGHSEGTRTTIIEFADAIKEIVKQHGKPEAVIAHSFGGVATLFAIMNGLPVHKLVNIASPTIGDEVIKTYLRTINGSWKTGEFFKRYMVKTYGKSFDEFSSLHFVQHLPVSLELLLVHDENDKEVGIDHALTLIKQYPRTFLIKTKGLGHTRILKDDAVIRRCVTFIRDRSSV
jgi:predicted alpha/beta hydrolase family esterase